MTHISATSSFLHRLQAKLNCIYLLCFHSFFLFFLLYLSLFLCLSMLFSFVGTEAVFLFRFVGFTHFQQFHLTRNPSCLYTPTEYLVVCSPFILSLIWMVVISTVCSVYSDTLSSTKKGTDHTYTHTKITRYPFRRIACTSIACDKSGEEKKRPGKRIEQNGNTYNEHYFCVWSGCSTLNRNKNDQNQRNERNANEPN